LTLASGQTLAGIGSINGSLVVSLGATVAPAGTNSTIGITAGSNPTGTLAASNNITLNGTTIINLNGSGTNDQVQAGVGITYGGTLNLLNISGVPLAAGNSFQIFSAASYSGSFSNVSPAVPGPGLEWNTNQLNNGILSVVEGNSQPVISGIQLSGSNLILTGSNGVSGGTYYILTSTNVAAPIANWTTLSTNNFDSNGFFSITNSINSNISRCFYLLRRQ
jgi:hypothetical protein